MAATQSVYGTGPAQQAVESHTLSVLVDNEPGVLARVIGLFSGRGYNIDSLTVAETNHARHLSRITIVCSGTPMVVEQIKNQLGRLVPVRQVSDLTIESPFVDRELALVKVAGAGDKRIEALRIADIFRARVVDSTLESFVFEITGTAGKVNAFIELMLPLGLLDVCRTGVAAIARGSAPAPSIPAPQDDTQAGGKTNKGALRKSTAKTAPRGKIAGRKKGRTS